MAAPVTTALPLSDDAEAILHRKVAEGSKRRRLDHVELHIQYEIERTVTQVVHAEYKHVALQFPDELLPDAAAVVAALEIGVRDSASTLDHVAPCRFYVLGDTSYGSCCVDEVAAEHIGADAIVHYGRSCLSPTSRLPVIYVFGKHELDLDALRGSVGQLEKKPILLVFDVTYASWQDDIEKLLSSTGHENVVVARPAPATASDNAGPATMGSSLAGRKYFLPTGASLSDYTLLYIGPPSTTLTTTLMTHNSLVADLWSFDPTTSKLQRETAQNISIRRRYAQVLKARDAGVIGIVVGTLGVARYLELLNSLRGLILRAGKKPYTFAMGKLNPAKMANFAEVDAFVLVACGENSLIESRDFYKPVVTPFELRLALEARSSDAVLWTGSWITDFERVLTLEKSESQVAVEERSEEEQDDDSNASRDDDAPHFSLVTGKYSTGARPIHTALKTATDEDYVLARRVNETSLTKKGAFISPALEHLKSARSWTGLGSDHRSAADDLDGQDDSGGAVLTEGRAGIARDYGTPS
ncbi:Diphthamide biosynthesis protein 2 [Savitreella phatthalungensis]